MSNKNLNNRVVITPESLAEVPPMSHPQSPTQPDSISELELAVRLGLCLRAILNRRKSGKNPPHFLARAPYGHKPQVRYLLSDVENFEQTNPKKPQAQK